MTTSRRSRGSRPRSRTRRRTNWQQTIFDDVSLLATGAIVGFDLTPEPIKSEAAHRGGTATCVRLIADFDLSNTNFDVSPQVANFGIAVVDHEAQTGPSFMDPASDTGQDWYYWTNKVVSVASSNLQRSVQWNIDIRTSRRLRGGYDLLMVAAAHSTNTDTLVLNVGFRILWMQP